MLFTAHAVTGATIGLLTGNPLLGFFGGFISHSILDSIPHLDQGSFYIDKDKGPAWLGADYVEKGEKFKIKRDWAMLIADFLIACGIGVYILLIVPVHAWQLGILGGVGGLMNDILDISPFWKHHFRKLWIGKKVHAAHKFFHWPLSAKYWYIGLATQLAILVLDLYLINRFF